MQKIHIIARFTIQQGKLNDFKVGADECVKLTKKEPGAELYDWFIDEDKGVCTVVETYKDSDAALFHVGNVNVALGHLMTMADFSVEVFGNASDGLRNALAQMNIAPVPFYKGLQSKKI